jgi:hypothetical protein
MQAVLYQMGYYGPTSTVKSETTSIYQTGYAFPNGTEFDAGHKDKSVIEFIGERRPTGMEGYRIKELLVYA